MSVLTSSGITFGDSTSISSKYSVISQTSTPLYFFQASAPTGWAQVASNNNKAMRVVSGLGAGTGGSNSFTDTFTSRTYSANFNVPFTTSVDNHTITSGQLVSHSHPVRQDRSYCGRTPQQLSSFIGATFGGSTGNAGNGGAHAHPSSAAASASWSSALDMAVQYIDVIYCTFS